MANVAIYVNVGSTDAEVGASGTDFIQFSPGNDKLIFTSGSPDVADGEDTPTQQELISAGIVLSGVEVILDDYLLLDASANELFDIPLMGNTTNRYVLAFDFDDVTASEPVLEVWDDSNLNTITGEMLGAGTPSQSFIRGITTTYSAPPVNWVGNRMAGSGSGNFLYLNGENGALTAADILYANIKVIVPDTQTTGFSANPVFVVKWLSN
jgi:hypothetical protein